MFSAAPSFAHAAISGYELISELGAGGMGIVFKAHDTKLERTVALKFLHPLRNENPAERQRLLREARAASRLDHPNIATVHAVEETAEGRLCIVLGYYDGETLAAKIQQGPLQRAKAIDYIRQVARGLEHAHAHGIVHRDIKPSNIIVTHDNIAKIVDFGLARMLTTMGSTQSGGLSGTIPYLSPEQMEGKAADARADIWSLGVLLYHMLTGRLPFSFESTGAMLTAILFSAPAPMPEVTEDLQAIIYRCLSKNPDARYGSCAELLRDLEKAEPVNPDAATAAVVTEKAQQQWRIAAASAGVTGAASPNRKRWAAAIAAIAVICAMAGLLWWRRGPRPPADGATSNPVTTTAASESYLKAVQYLERYDKPGNVDAAIKLLETVAESDPSYAALAFSALGEAYWDKYRMSQDPRWFAMAEEYCRRAAGRNRDLPAVYVTLGRVHNGESQRNLALTELQHALQLEPGSVDALLGMAAVYDGMGRVREAEDTFLKAVALRPEHWGGHYELGAFYYRHQRYAQAAEKFRRVNELVPDNAYAHSNLGVMLRKLGNESEAEKEFHLSLQLAPTYGAYANLASMYYGQQRWADAVTMTRKALEVNAADYRLWNNLALAYEWLGDESAARKAYDEELPRLIESLKLRPDDADSQAELALLYSKKKQRDKCMQHIDAALALAPADARVLAIAGEVYENLGQRQRARALLKQAMAKGWPKAELERNPGLRKLLADPAFQQK